MRLRQRMEKLEKRSGAGENPKLIFFITRSERREGGNDFRSAHAVVTDSAYFSANHTPLQSEPGETQEEFEERVYDIVEEKTGVRPS